MGSSALDGRPGGEGGGADPGVGDDRVTAAVAELYGADPQEFTDRRKALTAAARAAGDAAAAKQISALRKPTRAAWVVNRLARADPGAPVRLASLATALRAAEQARDGPRLRELSAARGPLIDALTGQALAAAGVPDPPAGLREEVAATLTAALADPDVAAGFAAGTLTRAAQWAGFGLAPSGPDAAFPDTPSPDVPAVGEPTLAEPLPGEPPPSDDSPVPDSLQVREGPARRESRPPAAASRPEPALAPTLLPPQRNAPRRPPSTAARPNPPTTVAEEAARQATRRREIFEDAERAVATAASAAAHAVAAEDRLEAEVRDLEERLTEARADLVAARLRARHAEAAERRARQALDRLPRP